MSDIVERLRGRPAGEDLYWIDTQQIMSDAADEIERLRAENESLRWNVAEMADPPF